jgi:hypothetical protein
MINQNTEALLVAAKLGETPIHGHPCEWFANQPPTSTSLQAKNLHIARCVQAMVSTDEL